MRAAKPTAKVRTALRVAAGACLAGAGVLWFGLGPAAAATTSGPSKTAWYDNSGAQQVTGATTPAAAQSGQLQVSYAPASATVPQQTIPTTPGAPGSPVAPPSGNAGGNTEGNTLSFAAVEYDVPMDVGGQAVDPSSLTAMLTLTLDSTSSSGISTGDIIACPTATTLWTAGGDQDSSQAPQYSCQSGSVTGNYDSTSNTLTFSLASAQENSFAPGSFSLVLVPGTTPSGAFQAVIAAPSSTSLTVTNESPLSNGNTNLNDSGFGTPAPGGNGGGLTAAPGDFAVQSFAPVTALPGATGSTPGGTSGAPSGSFAAAPVSALHGGLGSSTQRVVALVVLLAMAALLVMASSNPARAPRSLRVPWRDAVPVDR